MLDNSEWGNMDFSKHSSGEIVKPGEGEVSRKEATLDILLEESPQFQFKLQSKVGTRVANQVGGPPRIARNSPHLYCMTQQTGIDFQNPTIIDF